jgi:hypothetical protein
MGLDIYFTVHDKKDKLGEDDEEVGYFRKVNFLVKYFVDQSGFDVENQVPCKIDAKDVKELLDRCKKVIADHKLAEELLPTMSGFFFGSVEYGEDYFENVENVKSFCEELLEIMESIAKLNNDDIGVYFNTWY